MPSQRLRSFSSYDSQSSHASAYSESSAYSRSTVPTVYSDRPAERGNAKYPPVTGEYSHRFTEPDSYLPNDARSSVETYASTIPSQDDLSTFPSFEVPADRGQLSPPVSTPSTPQEFAQLFPSQRRLLIRHDDSTMDGNMNLCIDTEVAVPRAKPQRVSLFHLRLKDLYGRETSLRRYCRDSGREVCHSSRMTSSSVSQKRPGLQRSLTHALNTIGFNGTASKAQPGMKRSNTYGAHGAEHKQDLVSARSEQRFRKSPKVIQLEFSNYAHVNMTSSGKKSSKKYEFEYWGVKYQWKRDVRKEGDVTEVSYHLSDAGTSRILAHIMPESLTKKKAAEEEYRGGWIPPSSLWISDKRTSRSSPDLADVIVSTGLMVLVDDCIKRRWHSRRRVQLNIPMESNSKRTGTYLGPKRLVDEVFHRSGDTESRHGQPRQFF